MSRSEIGTSDNNGNWLVPDGPRRYLRLNRTGYLIIFAFALLVMLIRCIEAPFYITTYDATSYFNAAELIMHGEIDSFRTPVYPLILGIFKLLLGSQYLVCTATVVLQWIVFFVSIVCLGRIFKILNVSGSAGFLLVLIYASCPGITEYNYYILTESLSLSGIVFFIWYGLKCLKSLTIKNQIVTWAIVFVLIFLRPAFLFIIPLLVLCLSICIYNNFNQYPRIKIIQSALVALVPLVVIIGYVSYIHNRYECKSISVVTTYNNYALIRSFNGLPENGHCDADIIAAVDSIYRSEPEVLGTNWYFEITGLQESYGIRAVTNFVNQAIADNKIQVLKKMMGHFVRAVNHEILCYPTYSNVWNVFSLGFVIWYYIAIIWAYVLLRCIFVKKSYVNENVLLYGIYMGVLVTAIVGAPGEYGRLTLPCVVPALLFTGWLYSV